MNFEQAKKFFDPDHWKVEESNSPGMPWVAEERDRSAERFCIYCFARQGFIDVELTETRVIKTKSMQLMAAQVPVSTAERELAKVIPKMLASWRVLQEQIEATQ